MKSLFTVGVHIRTGNYTVQFKDIHIATVLTEEKAIALIKLLEEVRAFNPSNQNVDILLSDSWDMPSPQTPIG